jgi:hypothetical protein
MNSRFSSEKERHFSDSSPLQSILFRHVRKLFQITSFESTSLNIDHYKNPTTNPILLYLLKLCTHYSKASIDIDDAGTGFPQNDILCYR